MSGIKLSIIIPHYNSGDLLNKLLSSIPQISQIQIIVVDDHSNEKLVELAKCKSEYECRNVEFYVNECGKSAGGARNTGLKYAKGEWILFADADDYFLADFYDNVQLFFDKEYDLVFFRSTSIDLVTGKVSDRHLNSELYIQNYLETPDKKNLLQLKYNYFSPCAKLVRKELFLKYGIKFDEVLVANDVMCSIKLAVHTKRIFVSDKIIYCITKQPGTLTQFVTEERYDARMEVYYRRHRYLRENLPKEEYKLLSFYTSYRLQQAFPFGIVKVFKVFCRMICEGVPFWRELSPCYIFKAVNNYRKQLKK